MKRIFKSPKLCQVKRHCKVFKQNYTSNSGSQSGNNRNSCSCANISTDTDSGPCGNICTNTDSSSNSQCCNSRIFFILENQYSSRYYSTNVKKLSIQLYLEDNYLYYHEEHSWAIRFCILRLLD